MRTVSRFGTIDPPHAGLEHHPDNPDVMISASRKGEEGGKYNAIWHSDESFDEAPPAASMLLAEVLPPVGGDTLFVSMYAAWEALSGRLKAAVGGMEPTCKIPFIRLNVRRENYPCPPMLPLTQPGWTCWSSVPDDTAIRSFHRIVIPTGLVIAIPEVYEGQIRPRFGLAMQVGLTVLNAPGTIE